MIFRKGVVFLVFMSIVLGGCGTMTSFQAQRAPSMDTSGIQRLSVMPFKATTNNSLQNEAAQYVTTTALSRIRSANHFTMVDSSEVDRLQKSGENIADHVDALFSGNIVTLLPRESSRTEERKNSETGEITKVTIYEREVEMVFTYRLIRSRDGSLIDMITREGTAKDSNENKDRLKSNSQLMQAVVNSQLANLAREVAPYTVTVNRFLMSEKSRNKELIAKMKEIAKYVEAKSYSPALDKYMAIYDQYNNEAAAYNAAIMLEVLGELDAAISLLENAPIEIRSWDVNSYLDKLKESRAEQQRFASGFGTSDTPRDKVIALAVDEISNVLPKGSKLWIFNNSKDERALSEIVVDGMVSGLLKKGVVIVDRENSKLMDAEQKFQSSGNVSDSDFVSIGNAAGANMLATVVITGTSSNRRLQIRILDIEKRTNIFQTDASSKWNL